MLKIILFNFVLFLHCFARVNSYEPFAQNDESAYLGSFDTLIKDSYSAPLPNDLKTACKNKNLVSATAKTITSSMTATQLQTFCGLDTICTIPAGFTVTMNSNLNLAALVVKGTLLWTDVTQFSNEQWLCAGYIAVRNFNTNKKRYFECHNISLLKRLLVVNLK